MHELIGLSPTARALAVADMTDALLADRPYRQRLDPSQALRILRADCGRGALCPVSVAAVAEIVANGGTGESVGVDERIAV